MNREEIDPHHLSRATTSQGPLLRAPSGVILSAVCGTLLALAFPYPSLWPLAWIALAPFLVTLRGRTWLQGAGLGYAFGLPLFGITLRWAAELDPSAGWLLWLLFVLLEALRPALFGAFAARLLRSEIGPAAGPLALASTWVLLEHLRASGPYALTWTQISYSQLPSFVFVQMADVTGAMGVSFLVVLVNACIAQAWMWRRENPPPLPMPPGLRRLCKACAVAVVLSAAYGVVRWLSLPLFDTSDGVRVACVQPNINPHEKWDPMKLSRSVQALEAATLRAGASQTALVVWPETAIPAPVLGDPVMLARVQRLAQNANVNILAGSTDRASDGRLRNTAFLVTSAGRVEGRYDKMHLVPFGEFLPLRWLFAGIAPFNTIIDLVPGEAPTVFEVPGLRFGTLICFESTFADLGRRLVNAGAQALVVITNDGWFNRTSAAENHIALSAMRAIELRTWVIQCGNTGVSAFIDPSGCMHQKTELLTPAEIYFNLRVDPIRSIYRRYGDWFVGVVGAIWLVTAAGALRVRA